jgi:hypothetical protein
MLNVVCRDFYISKQNPQYKYIIIVFQNNPHNAKWIAIRFTAKFVIQVLLQVSLLQYKFSYNYSYCNKTNTGLAIIIFIAICAICV